MDWRSDDGRVGLVYLSPPWTPVAEGPTRLDLQIDAEVFGVDLADAPPTHAFHLGQVEDLRSLLDVVGRVSGADGGLPAGTTGGTWGAVGTTGGESVGWGTAWQGSGDGGAVDLPELEDTNDPLAVALFDQVTLLAAFGGRIDDPVDRVADGAEIVSMQVVLDAPEAFVRGFYYPSTGGVVRVVFASMFQLDTPDVDAMVASIVVEGHRVP